jgi:SNF2 family DNA or RNA helicase
MGLGKTLQAITAAVIKKELFGFRRTLIVCPASLKEQWKREIERFTGMNAVIVSGGQRARQKTYECDPAFFLVTNYEAVLRDILVIRRCPPDLVILDEAQRIKNFNTKTHQAILSIPRKQSLVITGTPLENKLEDLYAIVQFSDPELLSPFWVFSATHLVLSREKKKICGYANIDALRSRLANLVIRRKKEEVLDSLPAQVTNVYYVDLAEEQRVIHHGFFAALMPLLDKKILTPLDVQRIHELLLCMRMVCDSTFLIDDETNVSPKLAELSEIVREIVIDNRRKTVIFSEWTTMTYLIGKMLSGLGIGFVEFTGKVRVDRRQALIAEFESNPECMVFLSTDAGGVGLNLQAADCVINVELPWNPAKLNQRIGRVARIGQKSSCINVINLIARGSIEERVAAGLASKQELFDAVFEEDGASYIDFSEEKRTSFVNSIRRLMNEEPVPQPIDTTPRAEIEDDTPYFLNPRVLEEEGIKNLGMEEGVWEDDAAAEADFARSGQENPGPIETHQDEKDGHAADPAAMEEVLNNGLKFLSGLSSMMSGKPLSIEGESKAVSIDRETGEVTLKFRLPGFGPRE